MIDFDVAVVLLFTTLTIEDQLILRSTGILASLECRLWNTQLLLWGFFLCSTWNIVALTFER